ncbi:MAG: RusA family crossover junction endodeoxyribonuclease [Phycisphaeraceae bacterium]|nr:RusA family crossover junction endodeoxyribonuclease [Phycisphaeraceae bacterium]
MRLVLPYPPSINHYWRHFRDRTVISQEGWTFRQDVQALLAPGTPAPGRASGGPRKPPSGGRVALAMDAFPPDRRRRDLDNLQKPVLDALEHAGVYEDDSQVDLLVTRRSDVIPGGCLVVRVMDFPLAQCPVCGAEMN